jgi:hypothetical protein
MPMARRLVLHHQASWAGGYTELVLWWQLLGGLGWAGCTIRNRSSLHQGLLVASAVALNTALCALMHRQNVPDQSHFSTNACGLCCRWYILCVATALWGFRKAWPHQPMPSMLLQYSWSGPLGCCWRALAYGMSGLPGTEGCYVRQITRPAMQVVVEVSGGVEYSSPL